jgi:hypothetical protein
MAISAEAGLESAKDFDCGPDAGVQMTDGHMGYGAGQSSVGLVLRASDGTATLRAKKAGLGLTVTDSWDLPYVRTLFAAPGTIIPWDLIPAAMHFLERWDIAAPLWRYGVLAKDQGTPADQKRTEAVIRDLRVLLYAHELLFVRNSPDGLRFLETWRAECGDGNGTGSDERLAFLRALYLVKPLFCALPRSWLADLQKRSEQDARTARSRAMSHQQVMVRVQIGANVFVSCPEGQEQKTLERFARMRERSAR